MQGPHAAGHLFPPQDEGSTYYQLQPDADREVNHQWVGTQPSPGRRSEGKVEVKKKEVKQETSKSR